MYAMIHAHNDDIIKEEKFLKHSNQKLFDLYALQIQLMIEVQKQAAKKLELSKKKHLATKEDLNPNTKFVYNRALAVLTESASLATYLDSHGLNNWDLDDEYVKIIWKELEDSDLYRRYMNIEEDSFQNDKTFLIDFYKEVIAPSDKLAEYYEDTTISWVDDIPYVNTAVVKALNKLKKDGPFFLGSLYKDVDDEKFVSLLFKKAILHHTSYEEDIKEKTPNWETDRIADMDMILIKMAITEFLHFPSIPTRVTINEYIEIAKDYSTQKSSYFINGVLDKLSKEFIENKRIVKIGRGLL